MVRRTHSYADGGKIVKSETDEYPAPTYMEAVKDRVGELFTRKKKAKPAPVATPAPAPAKPKSALQGGRKAQLDKAIEDAGG